MIKIDGKTYNVPVVSIKRKADFLDKYAERNEEGDLLRELIGVYFNYQLQFGKTTDTEEYEKLWDKLTEPIEFHTVTVPDESGDYTFKAYFSNVGDEIRKQAATKNYWRSLTVNFTAKTPARK
ncbi:MAG: hypothetical protein PHW03_07260 [Eubacteriales bacterium]|nr:hypothetical protein [Eubacteriales bacterium]